MEYMKGGYYLLYLLSEVIAQIQEDQIFKAYFANTNWYITKSFEFIRYCDEDGNPDNIVPLTPSNLGARYEFIK